MRRAFAARSGDVLVRYSHPYEHLNVLIKMRRYGNVGISDSIFDDVDVQRKEKVGEERRGRHATSPKLQSVASGTSISSCPQKIHHHPTSHQLHLCAPSPSASHTTMLQQRLARSLQILSRQSQVLRTPTVASTPFSAARLRAAPAASQQLIGRRWYSSTEESDKKQEEVLKDSPEATKDASKDSAKEDPVQKELEAKKKENLDLTVCWDRS